MLDLLVLGQHILEGGIELHQLDLKLLHTLKISDEKSSRPCHFYYQN